MPELLPLFPASALPAPLTHFAPHSALPDLAERVRHLRRWQQAIQSGYVRAHKEEALQAEFLNLLFGDVLGYEYQATSHRQLQLELKTLTDGTKPDGALGEFVAAPGGGLGGPVRAVVELKDARTALDAKQRGGGGKGRAETPVEQAFSYPSKFGGACRWVLVSNFLELRLYAAQDQTRAEVFQLDTLPDQPEQLRRFFALLLPQHLLPAAGSAHAPLDEALQQRQQEETKITKAFYKDYSAARRQLLDHLIEQNPAVPPLELLAHTQKLLDRVIFVCFCEDKNIIPRLTFRRLLDAVRANVFDPADDKVYRTVRGLFRSIDEGNPAANINRFNGGLFAPDAALDGLSLKDRTLTPVIQLEQYDFASDLNVNILGHIFEQSLSDLEQERARLSGLAYDQKQGKRKQDGIFYTPEYITRYIVRQAVGGWLLERRHAAGLDELPALDDKDRQSIRVDGKGRLVQPSARVQRHLAAWEQYREALENIRVLDPACGSGAFLIEAFGYLLREGQQVNQELAALRGGQTTVFDLDRHILQHNLYGVDLNPESVDITRLSLWLQTANPGKPLTSLDHSIRCGNSLISDPAVAGPRAFNWPTAFPEVFEQGGFDVVIGNPPYGAKFSATDVAYLKPQYHSFANRGESYVLFIEQANKLLRPAGQLGYIIPDTYLTLGFTQPIRSYLLENTTIKQIVTLPNTVFADAVVDTNMLFTRRNEQAGFKLHQVSVKQVIDTTLLEQAEEVFIDAQKWYSSSLFSVKSSNDTLAIIEKLEAQFPSIDSFASIFSGIKVYEVGKGKPAQTVEIRDTKPYTASGKPSSDWSPFFDGKDIGRYLLSWQQNNYIHYGPWLAAPRAPFVFEGEKILIRKIIGDTLICTYIPEESYCNTLLFVVKINADSKVGYTYLLSILNSKFIGWFFRQKFQITPEDVFPQIMIRDILQFPIPNISPAEQQPFIAAAEALLAGHKALHEAEARAGRLVQAELGVAGPLTGKLALTQPWKTWSAALEKALGRKLSLPEKSTWLDYLDQFQEQQQQRRAALLAQDAALDQLVYQLYQLTPAEIALVEAR